ncbi:hypothetical protein D3C87_84550 [compost metagenome]
MSVLHQLTITPQSNTKKSLSDIELFISELIKDGLIIDDFVILTGKSEKIAHISTWDFNDYSIGSKVSNTSGLTILETTTFDSLSPELNYAFKIQLTKNHTQLENLDVFQSTDEEGFPMFVSYLAEPVSYTFYHGDEEEFEQYELVNINCIVRSDGRNSRALWDLLDNKQDYKDFFDKVRILFEDFVAGSSVE